MEKSKGGDSNDPKVEGPGALSRSEITHEDHPLSLGTTSLWNNFFKVFRFQLEISLSSKYYQFCESSLDVITLVLSSECSLKAIVSWII